MKTNLKTIILDCRTCGKTFSLTPEQQESYAEKELHNPTNCERCREKKRNVEYIPCKDCGATFEINELEKEFYEKKGYLIPKRCPDCRRIRRERKESKECSFKTTYHGETCVFEEQGLGGQGGDCVGCDYQVTPVEVAKPIKKGRKAR